MHVGQDIRIGAPAIDRKGEGGLCKKDIAAHRFKGRARFFRLGFIVAAHDPHFAVMLDPDLARAQDVPSGMKGHCGLTLAQRFSVGQRFDMRVRAHTLLQNSPAGSGGQIGF
jgi:hypothetical protein